jgi:acyl-CoA dehydrogenase
MDFELSVRAKDVRERLLAFMDEAVYPAEPEHAREVAEADTPHVHTQTLEGLKAEARSRGLWNLFLPDEEHGGGLSNADYAPLAEIMGRTKIASEACNCNAPDTGNMEVLHQFGTPEQKAQWLEPLLGGRSARRSR